MRASYKFMPNTCIELINLNDTIVSKHSDSILIFEVGLSSWLLNIHLTGMSSWDKLSSNDAVAPSSDVTSFNFFTILIAIKDI